MNTDKNHAIDNLVANITSLIFILVITIMSWPELKGHLSSNQVFTALCSFLPLLGLKGISTSKLKNNLYQLITALLLYGIFHSALKGADWNQSHWLYLHAVIISSSVFFSLHFFNKSLPQALSSLRWMAFPFIPTLFVSFFLFWYLKSTHGISFSFEYFWFFSAFFTFILSIFFILQSPSQTNTQQEINFNNISFYLCFFLFITTIIWLIRAQLAVTSGDSRLFWAASLFLVFASICNGVDPQYRKTKWGRINSSLYILLAAFQLTVAIVELSKYGPLESRYFHFFMAIGAIIAFLPNFMKTMPPIPLRLNALSLLLIITFVGPLNIYKLSFDGQKQILWDLFAKNNMVVKDKIFPAKENVSNQDKLRISTIVHYIYHNHDIEQLQEWFQFNIQNIFQNSTPFVVTADFDQDLANLKALMNNLNLSYIPKQENPAAQNPSQNRFSFQLVRLNDGSNSLSVEGYKQVINQYARPLTIKTVIKGHQVIITFNKELNSIETSIDGKIVHQVSLLEKYQSYMAFDDKVRHSNLDLHPQQMDLQFNTHLFTVKIVFSRISGFVQNGQVSFNHFEALALFN